MHLTFLGTGTSTGVPQIGCTCDVCRSGDPHDKRLRTSAMLETEKGTRVLIDCGPDFRQQVLPLPFRPIDGVLITHQHYDHVAGLDDLRPFCAFGEVNVYGEAQTLQHVRESMPYPFAAHKYPGVPRLNLCPVTVGRSFFIKELEIRPLRVMHGFLPILGYRFGPLAYITDMKTMPEETLQQLRGVTTLVVNGLRHKEHGSHQTIEDAIALSESLGSPRTWLIHFCHQAGRHADLVRQLPAHVRPAYDGLTIEI